MTGTALAIYQKTDPIVFVDKYSRAMCRMVGGQCKEDGEIAALTMLSEGLSMVEFSRKYHVIQGKLSVKADYMLAEWRLRGGKHRVIESSARRAAIEFVDPEGTATTFEMTWDEAAASRWPWKDWKDKSKGLKDNWSTDEDKENMLWSRLVSKSLKRLCPEIANGIYTPEELKDEENAIEGTVVASSGRQAIDPVALAASAAETEEEANEAETPATTDDGEVVDAEFQIVHDDTLPVGTITKEQDARMYELFDILGLDNEQLAVALSKRGVKRTIDLSTEQAAEMIQKMEDHLASKKSN